MDKQQLLPNGSDGMDDLQLVDEGDGSDDYAIHEDSDPYRTIPSRSSRQIQVIDPINSINKPQSSLLSASGPSLPNNPNSPGGPPILRRMGSASSVLSFMSKADFISPYIRAGSIKGSIFTMCISIVGGGCLSLPYAIRNAGLILGIVLIFVAAGLAYFTLDLLLISAEYLPEHLRGPKPYRDISYQSLALYSYGKGLSVALQCLMAVQYFGSAIAYVVVYAGLIELVWELNHDTSLYGWLDIYKVSVIVICIFPILPLSLLRNVSSLRFTSILGFSCAIYLTIVVVIEYFVLCDDISVCSQHERHGVFKLSWENQMFRIESFSDFYQGVLTAFPLIIFAYTGHPFLLPLYVELARPSIRRMRKVFRRGLIIINILYLFVSIFGFLLFLDTVCGNLLLNQFHKHADVIIAALGIALSCILTEPIFAYNERRMLARLFWNKKGDDISTFRHATITIIFVCLMILLGIFLKSISQVFGFLGSTTYPLLGYILPALFFCKIVPAGEHRIRKIFAIMQAVFVGFMSIASLAYKIHSPDDLECNQIQTIG